MFKVKEDKTGEITIILDNTIEPNEVSVESSHRAIIQSVIDEHLLEFDDIMKFTVKGATTVEPIPTKFISSIFNGEVSIMYLRISETEWKLIAGRYDDLKVVRTFKGSLGDGSIYNSSWVLADKNNEC